MKEEELRGKFRQAQEMSDQINSLWLKHVGEPLDKKMLDNWNSNKSEGD